MGRVDSGQLAEYVTASVGSSFRWLTRRKGQEIVTGFRLSPFCRHIVGKKPPFGVSLADREERVFQHCSGQFGPCTYLAVGPLIHVAPSLNLFPDKESHRGHTLVMDCGYSLDISERLSRPPHVKPADLREGAWIAALANLDYYPDREVPPTRCTVHSFSLFDIRLASETFGQVIPWESEGSLPHDPDVIAFPTVFATFRFALP